VTIACAGVDGSCEFVAWTSHAGVDRSQALKHECDVESLIAQPCA